jgi:hypothetical protein
MTILIERRDKDTVSAIRTLAQRVTGRLKAVSQDNLTVETRTRDGRVGEEVNYLVSPQVRVTIEGKSGTIRDLPVGVDVGLMLSADNKQVLGIVRAREALRLSANSQRITGQVKSIDVKQRKITLIVGRQAEDKTFKVASNVRVSVNGQQIKFEEIQADARVSMILDNEMIIAILVHSVRRIESKSAVK